MKIDRLIAITMFLLNRETVSAATLAERFEVSKRTIQRDIETLNNAGIPIVSTFGSDGGYEILDGFRFMKQIANLDDYINIIVALKGLSSAYESRKINDTLEKTKIMMQVKEPKIYIDFSVANENKYVNELLKTIEQSIDKQNLLHINYTNAENIMTERVIEPLALSFMWYSWYVLAYCTEKKDYRIFKLTRIVKCENVSGFFSKVHDNVDLLMENITESNSLKSIKVKLLCKSSIRQQVLEYLSTNIVSEKENGDFIVELNAPSERMWFSLIMGFGNQIEVIEPLEIKNLLKQKAEEIIKLYE